MNTVEIISANPLIWIFSIIVTCGVGYLFRLGLMQRKSISIARQAIVNAFCSELDALIQCDRDAWKILTDDAFIKHESVIRNNIDQLTLFQRQKRLL